MFSVPAYVAIPFGLGMMIPAIVASLAGGYILGTYVWDRFAKTVLGVHVRHWFTRLAPSKFFPDDSCDERLIIETIRNAIASGKLKLKDLA